jgi:hypothetical protein
MLCPRDPFKTSFLVVGYALVYTICEESQIAKDGLMFISFSDDLQEITWKIGEKQSAKQWNGSFHFMGDSSI